MTSNMKNACCPSDIPMHEKIGASFIKEQKLKERQNNI
jgi:hypothetical protein